MMSIILTPFTHTVLPFLHEAHYYRDNQIYLPGYKAAAPIYPSGYTCSIQPLHLDRPK